MTEQGDERVHYENIVDEVMRRPATEFKGPNDPDLDVIINYLRYIQMKHDVAKRSFADPINPDLWKIAAESRGNKPKTFRRF